MVNISINGNSLSVPEGTTILKAAEDAGIPIPHLCYLKDINEIAACRMCVVEVEGEDRLVTSCNNEVEDGMIIKTNSPRVREARRINLRLILSQHDTNCAYCVRGSNCELHKVAQALNIHYQPYPIIPEKGQVDLSNPVVREVGKCIKCMRCVQICDKVQGMHIWDVSGTGARTTVGVAGSRKLGETDCTFCGQCVTHCPTGALSVRDDTMKVIHAIANPDIVTVVQVAPAVRSAWAETYGLSDKKATPGRMVAALKQIGFDYVFDTNFAADLTIMEEANEFVDRFTHSGRYRWPMFTSCCPGWVSFMKSQYPDYVDHLSTAKSPQQMFGAIVKSYFAKEKGIDPSKIFVISVMPCSAKKAECELPDMKADNGDPDVDVVLTTREMIRILKSDSITPESLGEEEFDSPLGSGTGAAVIFGATGGVMDAALRTAYNIVTGKNPDADAFREVRGIKPWKEATYNVPGAGEVRVAVVSGLGNARALMEAIDKNEVHYDFVEVMACPGGCAGGGGQPIHEGKEMAGKRGDKLWKLDAEAPIRYSHENPDVVTLYRDYLQHPLGKKSHRLLHTHHEPKERD